MISPMRCAAFVVICSLSATSASAQLSDFLDRAKRKVEEARENFEQQVEESFGEESQATVNTPDPAGVGATPDDGAAQVQELLRSSRLDSSPVAAPTAAQSNVTTMDVPSGPGAHVSNVIVPPPAGVGRYAVTGKFLGDFEKCRECRVSGSFTISYAALDNGRIGVTFSSLDASANVLIEEFELEYRSPSGARRSGKDDVVASVMEGPMHEVLGFTLAGADSGFAVAYGDQLDFSVGTGAMTALQYFDPALRMSGSKMVLGTLEPSLNPVCLDFDNYEQSAAYALKDLPEDARGFTFTDTCGKHLRHPAS